MKTLTKKLFEQLATLPADVLIYTLADMQCQTLGELVNTLKRAYIVEDAWRVAADLQYNYNTRNSSK